MQVCVLPAFEPTLNDAILQHANCTDCAPALWLSIAHLDWVQIRNHQPYPASDAGLRRAEHTAKHSRPWLQRGVFGWRCISYTHKMASASGSWVLLICTCSVVSLYSQIGKGSDIHRHLLLMQ